MTPTVTTYIDRARQTWYVNIYWPRDPETNTPPFRRRPSLGIPASEDPGYALAEFKRRMLPGFQAEYEAHREAHSIARTASRTQGPPLRDIAGYYLETHLPFTGVSQKTIDYYRSSIDSLLAYLRGRHITRARQLSSRIIQEWQIHNAQAAGKDGPMREQILHVRRWITTCQDLGELPDLPDLKWLIPKKKKGQKHRAHPRAEINAWLQGFQDWRPAAGLAAAWAAHTGWRISDVLDLRAGEINHERRWIDRDQIKTDSQLNYPLTPALQTILDQALEGRKPDPLQHVFLNHKNRPWRYAQIYQVLVNYNTSHWDGDPITFRDLRKSFGTHLALDGCPPNVLRELMGHKDISITLKYYVQVDHDAMRKWSDHYTANTLEKKDQNRG